MGSIKVSPAEVADLSKVGHTPGPWVQGPKSYRVYDMAPRSWMFEIRRLDSAHVASCFGSTAADAEANARLIAAAPELLAACKLALASESDKEIFDHATFRALTGAIARAEGR